MENSFEDKTEILLDWDAIGFLGHLLPVPLKILLGFCMSALSVM